MNADSGSRVTQAAWQAGAAQSVTAHRRRSRSSAARKAARGCGQQTPQQPANKVMTHSSSRLQLTSVAAFGLGALGGVESAQLAAESNERIAITRIQ